MAEARYNCCPACGRRIDARRAIWNSEITAFRCKGCDARLVKKTARIWFGIAGLLSWIALKDRFGWAAWQTWVSMAALLAVMATIALLMTSVRLATEHDPDPKESEPIPKDPPPLDPVFRGASGPPPAASAGKDSSGD